MKPTSFHISGICESINVKLKTINLEKSLIESSLKMTGTQSSVFASFTRKQEMARETKIHCD